MSALSTSVYPVSKAVAIARTPAARASGVTSAGFQVPATRQQPYARRLEERLLTPSEIVCMLQSLRELRRRFQWWQREKARLLPIEVDDDGSPGDVLQDSLQGLVGVRRGDGCAIDELNTDEIGTGLKLVDH